MAARVFLSDAIEAFVTQAAVAAPGWNPRMRDDAVEQALWPTREDPATRLDLVANSVP